MQTNLVKNELELVRKKHLEKLSRMLQTPPKSTNRKTQPVIGWFKSLPQKDKSRFINFEIV